MCFPAMPKPIQAVSIQGREACNASNRGDGTHHNPRRCFPGNQREERRQYDCEVEWLVDATSPYRLIQSRQQNSYHACVDTREKCACLRVRTQLIPKRQDTDNEQQPRQKQSQQSNGCSDRPVRLWFYNGTQIGGEGEERSGNCLRCPITR